MYERLAAYSTFILHIMSTMRIIITLSFITTTNLVYQYYSIVNNYPDVHFFKKLHLINFEPYHPCNVTQFRFATLKSRKREETERGLNSGGSWELHIFALFQNLTEIHSTYCTFSIFKKEKLKVLILVFCSHRFF